MPDGKWSINNAELVKMITPFFPGIDEDGVCYGFSLMAMQATIANDMHRFNGRLETIEKMNPEELAILHKTLSIQRTNLIKNIKEEFNQLSPHKKEKLKQEILNSDKFKEYELKLVSIIDELVKEKKISPDNKLTELEQRLSSHLKNATLQNYIDNKLMNLNLSQQYILETLNFFESLSIHQDGIKDKEAQENIQASSHQSAEQNLPLTMSKKLEKVGGVNKASEFSGIYNVDEIQKMLDGFKTSLLNVTQDKKLSSPISFIINECNHCIHISYDKQKDQWQLLDINRPPGKSYTDTKNLAQEIMNSFSTNNTTTFTTSMYTHPHDAKIMKTVTESWQNDPSWQTIHEVTPEKARLQTSSSGSWLYIAAREGDIDTVEKLVRNGADVNLLFNKTFTPLSNAVYFERLEAAKVLIENGADPNLGDEDGFTPFHYAVNVNNINAVEIFIANGADINGKYIASLLFIAAQEGHKEIVELLCRHHANTNLPYTTTVAELRQFAEEYHVEQNMEAFLQGKFTDETDSVDILPDQVANILGYKEISKIITKERNLSNPQIYTQAQDSPTVFLRRSPIREPIAESSPSLDDKPKFR